MSTILGINDGHNASAALFAAGRLVGALQEERLTRIKSQWGMPSRALRWLLEDASLGLEDVDHIAVSSVFMDRYSEWDPHSIRARHATRSSPLRRALRRVGPAMALRRRAVAAARRRLLAGAGLPLDRVRVIEHHACHAYAAWGSWLRRPGEALVLTADGLGDYVCATVNRTRGQELTRLASVPAAASIGLLYSHITFLLGLTPLEHEHKVMGLAPYAADSLQAAELARRLRGIFRFDRTGLSWSASHPMVDAADELRPLIDGLRFDVVAAGVQGFLVDFLIEWVRSCVRATGLRRIAVSGGVFMNVKANQRIMALPEVDELYVLPSCGDETNSFGATYAVAASLGESAAPLEHLYLGPVPSDDEIIAVLRRSGERIAWHRPAEPEREVAELLAEGEIVARCAGPLEFGARALGNRSILANASRAGVVRTINRMIKSRDFWMPFAPAILRERLDEYVRRDKSCESPFMMLTFDSRPEKRAALAAAIHPYDDTARIQEVGDRADPALRRLLEHYAARTGEAALLNTSFNLHGYPMVNSAQDAIDVFLRSGLRLMQLGGYLVRKKETASDPEVA